MSGQGRNEQVGVLKLTLHGQLVGYLAGFQGGRNVLTFADSFKNDYARYTFSLVTRPEFPRAERLLSEPWVTNQRLHPVLSNLLPEGSLRELIAQGLKVHPENEFQIFSYLAQDLPGALIATPMDAEEVPEVLPTANGRLEQAVKVITNQQAHKFSLAGVQMKFSMKERDGRYNIAQDSGELGDWIIKTPSTQHVDLPLNEFTAMTLSALAGIDIPEIKLVDRDRLDNLPPIKLPDENLAFAIKRFDRNNNTRIHMEDLTQVLVKYPREKYNSANYEQIGRILFNFSGDGLADAQQFARRLLVNILLANGDAHLKNWSLLYQDKITPHLSPAYDIATTSVYMQDEREYALNLGKTKEWYRVDLSHFEAWAKKADIPWRAIKPHLTDVMDRARAQWPRALNDLPMNDQHKKHLRQHWQGLRGDFQI